MIGRTLKQFRVEELLGRGGMGVVYGAVDTRLERRVALKVLSPEFTADPERRQRFLREARAAGAISHPAIAQIYDVDEVDGVTFIAMERIEGETVRALVARRELDLPVAVEIALQVAQGLAKAHAAGVVHRDIKAENIMVTRDGHAKLLDFGLAKLLATTDGGEDPATLPTVARTQAGLVLGTVSYMSPEQARGKEVDHRSDIFSFGVVVYEMITGQLPFAGSSVLDTLHAIAFEETRPVSTIRADLPPRVQRVISRCLRKDPAERYQETARLVEDLRTVQREVESGISATVPLVERLRDGLESLRGLGPARWALAGLAGAGVLSAIVIGVVRGTVNVPGLAALGVLGLLIYRRFRNRDRRLLRRLAGKLRKMPEVEALVQRGPQITVVVDRALAKSYVRINALVDRINAKRFFGEPFSVAVRDDLSRDELRDLLRGPGVLFVRDDVPLDRTG